MRLAVSVAPRRVADGEFEAIPSRRTEDARAAEPTHGAVVKAPGTIRRLGFVLACGIAAQAHANHPVLVEGNNAANGSPGITVVRPMTVFGYDDAPHGHMEILFENVRVPATNLLLGEGRGFEIAQARLGPGRIHHCMRNIGVAERLLERICRRLSARVAFGKPIAEQSIWLERIANCRIMIDQARLLVLNAADKMDRLGNKAARREIAMIKVAAPAMLNFVVDWAIPAIGFTGTATDVAQLQSDGSWKCVIDNPHGGAREIGEAAA